MMLPYRAVAGLALLAAACDRTSSPASRRPAATTVQPPAYTGVYASVAADSSVRPDCVRHWLTPSGQDSCINAEYPLDTMVRRGFGNFAPMPLELRRCTRAGSIDTLVFGRITVEPETGDYTGSEFTFQLVGDSIRGEFREGEGGLSWQHALQGLRAVQDSDAVLQFWTTGGGRSKLEYRALLNCSSIRLKFRFVDVAFGRDTATVSPWYGGKPVPARRTHPSGPRALPN